MTLRDLVLSFQGWQEVQRQLAFQSWEEMRSSTIAALFKLSKSELDNLLRNPYSKEPKKERTYLSKDEVLEQLKKREGLVYKEHPKYEEMRKAKEAAKKRFDGR